MKFSVGLRKPYYSILLLVQLAVQYCYAQELPVATGIKKACNHESRNSSGKPGRSYWQNTAGYNIKVNFNPSTRQLSGTVNIHYTNNSPDTLKTLLLKLYPNVYKSDAMRGNYVAAEDLTAGVRIHSLAIDHQAFDSTAWDIRGTNMYVNGPFILPGQQVILDIGYQYTLNKGSFIRTGQVDSGAYFMAYFFPRITVYDDIDGWNKYPYTGREEFYNDYGNFHTEITVPGNYQVWATGDLENAAEIYVPNILQRINQAENNDAVTDIITVQDLQTGAITTTGDTHTWQFEAEHVTDFAFAISNHYVWKASSVLVDSTTKRRTRVDAVYNPDHEVYDPVVAYAGKTVALISHYFPKVPFPYSHETIFEGLDAMEYPMMVNNLPFPTKKETIQFTIHEVFHTLFPFYVGTNETKYAFMDEGWATMMEFYLYPMFDSTAALNYDISDVNNSAGTEEDVPIMTLTPPIYGKARYADKDLKPALGMLYLQEMLGDQLFLQAMHYYIDHWKGKHPTPYDFFNCMNTGSGVNLNWFWQNWFFEKNTPDLAIDTVIRRKQDYIVTVSRPGNLAVPVHLVITCNDGSQQRVTRNISCWKNGNKTIKLSISTSRPVRKLVLGNALDVDIHPQNNHWQDNK
jgi:hypothetical protein